MMRPALDPDYTRRPIRVAYPRAIRHPGGMCALPNGGIAFCDAPLFRQRAVCVLEPDGSTREFFRHDFSFIKRMRRPWAIAACDNGDFLVTDAVFGKLMRISSTGDIRWITPPDSPSQGEGTQPEDAARRFGGLHELVSAGAQQNAFMQSILSELVQESHSVPAHMLQGSLLHFPTDVKLLPDGRALVCDNHTQCILIVDPRDGRVLGNFEVRDESGAVQRVSPGSLALSPDGELVLLLDNVCGSVLFVRLRDGLIVRSLGCRGPLPDQFQEPLEMVLDARGNVLVSDTGGAQENAQPRIIVFRPDGSTALIEMPGRVNGGMLVDARGRLNFFCDGTLYRTCF